MKSIKVLIIDDSKLMQKILTSLLSSDPGIQVIGCADDAYIARDLIKTSNPDVVTLDIMMPHMDGITFLKNLMRLHPMPVVMISTLTQSGNTFTMEALAIGAIDSIHKPSQRELVGKEYQKNLITVIKNAATANVRPYVPRQISELDHVLYQAKLLRNVVIAIGASTGGIEALESILVDLPKVLPPIIITQHIKREFCTAFVTRINKLCSTNVCLGRNYDELLPGHAYIAPCDYHMLINKRHDRFYCMLHNGPPVNGHKPSVDILFHSVAKEAGPNAIGILLTGIGTDGAEGLKAIRDRGGKTMAQNKESSVVWGMPGAAVKLDAADYILPLSKISKKILQLLSEKAENLSDQTVDSP